eukprot:gene13755-biopygen12575
MPAPRPRHPKPQISHSPRHARATPAPRPRHCPVPPGVRTAGSKRPHGGGKLREFPNFPPMASNQSTRPYGLKLPHAIGNLLPNFMARGGGINSPYEIAWKIEIGNRLESDFDFECQPKPDAKIGSQEIWRFPQPKSAEIAWNDLKAPGTSTVCWKNTQESCAGRLLDLNRGSQRESMCGASNRAFIHATHVIQGGTSADADRTRGRAIEFKDTGTDRAWTGRGRCPGHGFSKQRGQQRCERAVRPYSLSWPSQRHPYQLPHKLCICSPVGSGHGALFVRGHAVHVVEHCIHAAVEERVVEVVHLLLPVQHLVEQHILYRRVQRGAHEEGVEGHAWRRITAPASAAVVATATAAGLQRHRGRSNLRGVAGEKRKLRKLVGLLSLMEPTYCRAVEYCLFWLSSTVVLSSCRVTVVLSSCRATVVLSRLSYCRAVELLSYCRAVELSNCRTFRRFDSSTVTSLSSCRTVVIWTVEFRPCVAMWVGGWVVVGTGSGVVGGRGALEVPSGSSLAAAPRIPRPTQATDGTAHSCSGGMERNEKAPSPPLAPRLRGEQKHESMWPWPRACGVDKNESLWLWPRACGTRHHRGLPAGVDSGHGALFVRGHAVHVVEHCIHAAVEERVVE